MEYRRLGNTGLMVSELCLGCMTFGQEADEETSKGIVDRFLEAGGNFIDTADVYSNGVSEETGKSYAQISLNWLLRQAGVTSPIIGARTPEQLDDNLGTTGWKLSEELVEDLSQASALEDVYPYRFIREAQRV